MWLPSPLEPVAMRLARADEAAFQIGRLALGWSREAFEMSEVERRPGWLDLVLKDIRPIPPLLVMLFSEAVHHLRAAVENVLFYLTELERGSALSSRHANAVTMPVKNTRVDFTAWQQRAVSTGVAELGPNTKLGKRIESLQPFVDTTASVPSLAPKLAASMGVRASSNAPDGAVAEVLEHRQASVAPYGRGPDDCDARRRTLRRRRSHDATGGGR